MSSPCQEGHRRIAGPLAMKLFREPRDAAPFGRAAHAENATDTMGNLALAKVNQEAKQVKATFPLQTLLKFSQSTNTAILVYFYWWLDDSGVDNLERRFPLALGWRLCAPGNTIGRFPASSGLP